MAVSLQALEKREKILIRSSEIFSRREAYIQFAQDRDEILIHVLDGPAGTEFFDEVDMVDSPTPTRGSAVFSPGVPYFGQASRLSGSIMNFHVPEGSVEEPIPANLVQSVDARDYQEREKSIWAMAIVMKEEPSHPRQYCMQFETKDARDLWVTCLQSHLRKLARVASNDNFGPSWSAAHNQPISIAPKSASSTSSAPRSDQRHRGSIDGLSASIGEKMAMQAVLDDKSNAGSKSITRIDLKQPDEGVVVAISMELENAAEIVTLDVKEHQTSSEDCKRLVLEFVHEHSVLKAETTSLYRYVRSIVQRALMERETESVVNEISAQHIDHLIANARTSNGVNAEFSDLEDIKKVLHESYARLTEISQDAEQRIGQHGPGAAIVVKVLRQNTEKMKVINEAAAKLHIKKIQEGTIDAGSQETVAMNDAPREAAGGGQTTIP